MWEVSPMPVNIGNIVYNKEELPFVFARPFLVQLCLVFISQFEAEVNLFKCHKTQPSSFGTTPSTALGQALELV